MTVRPPTGGRSQRMTVEARWPGEPPEFPRWPGTPSFPGGPPAPPSPAPGPVPPVRVWLDPDADWTGRLLDRLLERRIVLASGLLDDDAATRLSAQLLTLDAEGDQPIRLELQNLRAELPAALTVMGILDVLRVPVHGCVSGEISGPALGVLACCTRRTGYPNSSFTLLEPRLELDGTASAVSAREQQVCRMLDTLYFRLADVTGRETDDIREDARCGRYLTAAQAIGYGLIQAQEATPRMEGQARDLTRRLRHWPASGRKIALCTHSLSMGNIEPRVRPVRKR
jgi:ATP-dependent Clp protease, protease subunit